jgi:hypothetical protein
VPTPTEQLLSRTSYAGDGVTTAWNFTFASGYIDQEHVKAYVTDSEGLRTDLVLTPADFIGEFQLRVIPAVAVSDVLTIYRDTPKDAPLVDFQDGSNITEAALDTLARQAVFVAAEVSDELGLVVGPALQETAQQVADNAAAAAASAVASAASAVTAEGAATAAAAAAAAGVLPAVLAAVDPLVAAADASADAAAASATTAQSYIAPAQNAATSAAASASDAEDAAAIAQSIAGSLGGSFGFTNTAYDFGFVTDTATYLDLDCGALP